MSDLRDAIAKAALDAAYYTSDGECWVDPARIPADDDPDDWTYEIVEWDLANDDWRENGYRIADAVLSLITEGVSKAVAGAEKP